MKRMKDPFPPTPERFHRRVEATLQSLEEKDMNHKKFYGRTAILVAAIVAALLAATAVAAVVGNSHFKDRLNAEGAAEVAALVQEVHVPATGDEADGFALSIDEIIWEDDKLYFSYTASVPDDGNRYLLALYRPLLNGEPMVFHTTGWETSVFFDDRFQTAIPMGGTQPVNCGQLLTFKVNPALHQKAANALFLRAEFFRTDVAFTNNESGFDTRFKTAVPIVDLAIGQKDDSLQEYVERMDISTSESEALRAIADAAGVDGILTPEELSGVKGIEHAASKEVRMALDASKLMQTVYDGVEETEFERNGCDISILDFHMTHLGASIRLRVTAPAGMTEEEGMRLAYSVVSPMEDDNGNGYNWCLFRPDGSMLALEEGWSGGAGYGLSPDGRASYELGFDIDSIIPLEGLEKLVLMPYRMHYDDHDQPVYDYLNDWAVELTPILRPVQTIAEPIQALSPEEQADFDRAMNGEAMTRLERQVTAANWKAGDPTVTVYATERGKYYHVDIDCSGMRNAFPWAIEDAVEGGKLPCPDCVGGPNAPEKVDIMNIEF